MFSIPFALKINAAAKSSGNRTLTGVAEGTVVPLIYGEDMVGGKVLNILPGTTANTVLIQVLWGLQGQGVQGTPYYNNIIVTSHGGSSVNYDGSQSTADATMVAAFAAQSITYTDTLAGYMYSVITIPTGSFQATQLDFLALCRGRKVFDPRLAVAYGGVGSHVLGTPSTWTYSDNPTLALADFLYSTSYGAGETVDWASVFTCASTNDTLVGGVKRRLIGWAINDQVPVPDLAEALRAYASCFQVPSASGIKLLADADGSSIASYSHTGSTIMALDSVVSRDTSQAPTVVEIVYTDTTNVPYREKTVRAQLSGVGTTLPTRLSSVKMPGVQRNAQAFREAEERLNKLNLQRIACSAVVADIGVKHQQGDIIDLTHPYGSWSAKKFRITAPPVAVAPGRWRLPLTAHDAAAYSSSTTSSTPPLDPSSLVNHAPPNPTSLVIVEKGDGGREATIVVPTNIANVRVLQVRSQGGGTFTWGSGTEVLTIPYVPTQGTYVKESIHPVPPGTYSFGVKMVDVYGGESVTPATHLSKTLNLRGPRYTSGENLCPDPYFMDEPWWEALANNQPGWYFEFNNGAGNTPDTMDVVKAAVLWSGVFSGTADVYKWSDEVPFSAAGKRVTLRAKGVNGGNKTIGVAVRFRDITRGSSIDYNIEWASSAGLSYKELAIVVPANAAWLSFYLYVANGAAWSGVAGISEVKLIYNSDTIDLVPGAATDVTEHKPADSSSNFVNGNPAYTGGAATDYAIVSYTNPTADTVPVVVQWSAFVSGSSADPASYNYSSPYITVNGASVYLPGIIAPEAYVEASGIRGNIAGSYSHNVPSGQQLVARLRTGVDNLGLGQTYNVTHYWKGVSLTVEGIKR
jgi:hypothetical protein